MKEGRMTAPGIDTAALCNNLFKADNLKQFLQKNTDALHVPRFHEYIAKLCRERGEVPERVIKRANMESSFGHQIFSGRRNPSRDTVIQLAFGFEADVELAQTLLKYAARSPLYPRVKRDAAILYCLHNHIALVEAQEILHDLDLPLMGGKEK
ncbi:MAG: hypothetical protein Q4E65_07355 [Clostridia bacterium]|nr:hypothetical protein [Clostridia bacterium]